MNPVDQDQHEGTVRRPPSALRRQPRNTLGSGRFAATMMLALFSGLAMGRPSAAVEPAAVIHEEPISATDRDHWSFQPLSRPPLPPAAGKLPGWCNTPVDHFILARLASLDLEPQPAADRPSIVRRLYFDLLGLPPTPTDVAAFVDDCRPDAYERLVDRLLGSPHYGERWAQHWLDLARFAETDGFEHDKTRSEAWRYRDWVIGALNEDLPYDRFVRWQLAGDEIAPDNPAARIATAFCLSGPDMPDINSQEERRHHLLNELTSTVGAALMGLQIGCAQCHDHKYDPLSQADFYRLRAVFEPAVVLKKNQSVSVLQTRSRSAPSHLMIRGDWQRPGPEIAPGVPRIAHPAAGDAPLPDSLPPRTGLARWLTGPDHPLTARVIANRVWQHHFGFGLARSSSDFGLVGEEPSHPELLDWLATELVRHDWHLKPLHRLIVCSATYRQASRPSQDGWSEQQLSDAQAAWDKSWEIDQPNYWLARFPRRRLSGEELRDALLVTSGTMHWHQGGPGVRPPLPAALVKTLLKNQWNVSPNRSDHFRRSVYLFARRNLRFPIFEAFDRPDANASCARRSRSTTAPQSLLLLNSDAALEASQRLAGRVLAESSGLDERLDIAVRHVLGRSPSTSERGTLGQFLATQRTMLSGNGRAVETLALPEPMIEQLDPFEAAAWTDLCLALYNFSEFLYVD